MQNSLRQSNNSLSPTLPVKDQYGRYQVGGPIGPGDIKNAMAADPQVQMGGNMLLDVTPVVESVRSVDRLPGQWQAYQNAESPIQQVLRAAEMALEGGALVADVIPHVKALGIGGAALIGLMARRTDEIEGIARFGLAKRQMGIIGGPKAKTADLAALEQAKALKAQGVDADTIYQETRWWLDSPDGVPKFEIDDSGMKVRNWPDDLRGGDVQPMGTVGENIDHPELYAAYPEARDLALSAERGPNSGKFIDHTGSGNPKEWRKFTPRVSASQDVLGHELQHGVPQRLDDMGQGGNPMMFSYRPVTEVINRQNRLYKSLNSEFAQKLELAQGDIKQIMRLKKENPAGYEEVNNALRELGAGNFDEARHAINDMEETIKALEPHEQYRRLAGESEARLVQDRMNMTMDERLANPFYKNFDVPLEDQIVRRDGGTALSRNGEAVKPETWYRGGKELDPNSGDPLFFTTDKSGADWFTTEKGGATSQYNIQPKNPLSIDSKEGLGEYFRIAKEAGVDFNVTGEPFDMVKGWNFQSNDIRKFSPYEGENVADMLYIPGFRDALKANGYDAVKFSDVLENTEIPAMVPLDNKLIAKGVSRNGESVLPMDQASRMARAKEMGMDTDTFHYSRHNGDITEFDNRTSSGVFDNLGVHSGTSLSAKQRAGKTIEINRGTGKREMMKGETYPLKIKKGRQLLGDDGSPMKEEELSDYLRDLTVEIGENPFTDKGVRALQEHIWAKYDSVPYINLVEDAGSVSYISPPKNIRSKFATFDPAKRNSPKLLDSKLLPIPAAGLMGYGALREDGGS